MTNSAALFKNIRNLLRDKGKKNIEEIKKNGLTYLCVLYNESEYIFF